EVLVRAERDVACALDDGENLRLAHDVDAAGDDAAVIEHVHAVALVGEVPQEHVGLGGGFCETLLEVAGEVTGHHAAPELGADLRLGGEVRRGVMTCGEQRLPCNIGDDVEPVGAGEIHGVPGDAAAVDGHAHAGRG